VSLWGFVGGEGRRKRVSVAGCFECYARTKMRPRREEVMPINMMSDATVIIKLCTSVKYWSWNGFRSFIHSHNRPTTARYPPLIPRVKVGDEKNMCPGVYWKWLIFSTTHDPNSKRSEPSWPDIVYQCVSCFRVMASLRNTPVQLLRRYSWWAASEKTEKFLNRSWQPHYPIFFPPWPYHFMWLVLLLSCSVWQCITCLSHSQQ